MTKKDIFETVAEGFTDILRLYADLVLAPFRVMSAFVRRENVSKRSDERARIP